jgi:hypothetical protein
MAQDDECIEPRNDYTEDTIGDIKWSGDNTTLYVSTMGKVWIHKVDSEASITVVHEICEGRFPEIAVSPTYYAIGSDFLSTVSIYNTMTNALVYKIAIDKENVRSIGINENQDSIVVSTSNYTEDGFFDIDRNVEIWNFINGTILGSLVAESNEQDLYLPFNTNVTFLSDSLILLTGVDEENSFAETPTFLTTTWNWQTGEIRTVDIESNALLKILDTSRFVIAGKNQEHKLSTYP